MIGQRVIRLYDMAYRVVGNDRRDMTWHVVRWSRSHHPRVLLEQALVQKLQRALPEPQPSLLHHAREVGVLSGWAELKGVNEQIWNYVKSKDHAVAKLGMIAFAKIADDAQSAAKLVDVGAR